MILVFVGAGGSAAVDREQYPTTVEFFESLPGEIKNSPIFLKACEFLKKKKGKEIIDIEDVLEILDEFQEDCRKVTSPATMVGWTISGTSGLIGGINLSPIASLVEQQIAPLNSDIKKQVYEFYAVRPDTEKLATWIKFLKGLRDIDPTLEIFTTNYDLVLEDATEQAEINVEYGLVHSRLSVTLDQDFWDPHRRLLLLKNPGGLLTKLHGSVNWQRHNGDVIAGSPYFTGDHQNQCLLYPGYKGVPTEEPFRAFHNHLRKVVRGEYGALSAAIFIGFAFRDDYINTILSDLPPATPTYFITKPKPDEKPTDDERPPRAPSTNEYMHLLEGLTAGTVERCLKSLSKNVKHNRSPQNDPGS